jgi:4'-phosphopantetheinyl transferase
VSALQVIDPGTDRAATGIDLQLWWADLEAAWDATCLSEAVQQRATRILRERDRRRYLASHAALLQALGERGPWVHGTHGKPALTSPPPHFSLSRRDGVAAVALSMTHEVGVDVETLRTIDDARELAALHFTPREREAVVDDAGFLRLWTRKEACMKATGLGLSLPPSSFECGAQADVCRVRVSSALRTWTLLVHTPPVDAALILSWAVVLA